jgi:hypothetical protein
MTRGTGRIPRAYSMIGSFWNLLIACSEPVRRQSRPSPSGRNCQGMPKLENPVNDAQGIATSGGPVCTAEGAGAAEPATRARSFGSTGAPPAGAITWASVWPFLKPGEAWIDIRKTSPNRLSVSSPGIGSFATGYERPPRYGSGRNAREVSRGLLFRDTCRGNTLCFALTSSPFPSILPV